MDTEGTWVAEAVISKEMMLGSPDYVEFYKRDVHRKVGEFLGELPQDKYFTIRLRFEESKRPRYYFNDPSFPHGMETVYRGTVEVIPVEVRNVVMARPEPIRFDQMPAKQLAGSALSEIWRRVKALPARMREEFNRGVQ